MHENLDPSEVATPFLGVDPDDTAEMSVGGATFTIGVIDQGVWERINSDAVLSFEAAKRRAIKQLAAEELDPEEVVRESGEFKLRRVDEAALGDPAYNEHMVSVMLEAIRFAVRGHAGVAKKSGAVVPFKASTAKHEGGTVPTVGDDTLRYYRANPRLIQPLWLAIRRFQVLGEVEKKG